MKKLDLISVIILCLVSSCTSNSETKSENASKETESVENKPDVRIVYSYNGKNLSDLLDTKGPLSLVESNNHTVTLTDKDDVIAYDMNGKKVYSLTLTSTAEDTVLIDSVELPDESFDAQLYISKFFPGLLTSLNLLSDSAVTRENYRFVITYKNPEYSPQVFTVNLYPMK